MKIEILRKTIKENMIKIRGAHIKTRTRITDGNRGIGSIKAMQKDAKILIIGIRKRYIG